MLPTTNLDIVRRMRPDLMASRLPEDVRVYARLEYGGNADYAWTLLAQASRRREHVAKPKRTGAIGRLVAAIAGRFSRPGPTR